MEAHRGLHGESLQHPKRGWSRSPAQPPVPSLPFTHRGSEGTPLNGRVADSGSLGGFPAGTATTDTYARFRIYGEGGRVTPIELSSSP